MTIYDHNLPPLSFNKRMTTCELQERLELRINGELRSVVPADFISDGASVPRWAHWAVGRWGCHVWAALWHDWAYAMSRRGTPICSKKEADLRLYEIARQDGMHWRTAQIMYWAVRLFGGKNWRNNG